MTTIEKLREILGVGEGEDLPPYAWPGGYPILYQDRDGSTLCPECATKAANDPDEHENFKPRAYFIHYEGQSEFCEQCNKEIESAYGDPEAEEEAK